MKGKVLLKIVGILMIIGGAVSIIAGIFTSLIGVLGAAAGADGLLVFACFLVLISAALELVAGIVCVKRADKPEKATTCIVWCAIVAVLCVLGTILTKVNGGEAQIYELLIGLILPALGIVGAILNKKSVAV